VAVEVQQIESDEIEVMLAGRDGLAKGFEVGQPSLVGDDHLAVDDGAFDIEAGSGRSEVAVLRCPIEELSAAEGNAPAGFPVASGPVQFLKRNGRRLVDGCSVVIVHCDDTMESKVE
jgi:hypothetical protein